MGRSFLTDSSVNSLLFFVVFFIHMLVPLALAFVLWLHITRLARAALPDRTPVDDLDARICWWASRSRTRPRTPSAPA